MNPDTKNYIIGIASDYWAGIYRKRRNALTEAQYSDNFDKAAQINQPPFWGNMKLYYQDQTVKQIFREMVDYISQVKPD